METKSELFRDEYFVENKPGYEFVKRLFDIVICSFGLIVLSPLFALIALLIKLDDGGPVFYVQTRLTKDGKPFQMYKFRTMEIDADRKRSEMEKCNEMNGPVFKIKDDPRITKFGAFLRMSSMDELPQFVNIVKGEMSIVGPRPPIPKEVEAYTERQKHRLDVKTGLVCYREVNGRSKIHDFNQWAEMDLKYIRERGVLTDLRIFFKMIVVVFTANGAE